MIFYEHSYLTMEFASLTVVLALVVLFTAECAHFCSSISGYKLNFVLDILWKCCNIFLVNLTFSEKVKLRAEKGKIFKRKGEHQVLVLALLTKS